MPHNLVIEFWLRVRDLLQEQRLDGNDANRGIADYLALAEKHDFSEAIYHRNPEEIAEIIMHGVRSGFREPAAAGK